MGKKRKCLPPYLYNDDGEASFAMVTGNLLQAEAFHKLSRSAQIFYITCVCHKNTEEQRTCLYNTLRDFYLSIGEPQSDYSLSVMAETAKRSHVERHLFVFPAKQLAEYGYTPQLANRLKNELIKAGFIRVFAAGKVRNTAYRKMVTIYEFTYSWKKKV